MKSISCPEKSFIALLLCLAVLFSAPAALAAEHETKTDEDDLMSIIDPAEPQQMVENYISEHNLNPENISIGYCYTATGDTWFYNGNKWYYGASMYKVPLFMVYAQKVFEGELTQDSDINGVKLSDLENMVLVYSNNDYAHHAMNYLGGTPVQTHEGDIKCREQYQQFSDMPKEDYIDDFYDYSYFTPKFMMDVMETLYFENERFPNIIECLKQAQPDSYFNRSMGGKYEVAQKYGAFKEFNNTTGIIYTPNPFILTVMTEHMGVADTIISDCASMFEQYTLSLDEKLDSFREEEKAEEQKRLEEEKREAEEAERKAEEEKETKEQLEREEAERLEALRLEQGRAEKRQKILKTGGMVSACLLAATVLILTITKTLKRKRKAPEISGSGTPKERKVSTFSEKRSSVQQRERKSCAPKPQERQPAKTEPKHNGKNAGRSGRGHYTPRH